MSNTKLTKEEKRDMLLDFEASSIGTANFHRALGEFGKANRAMQAAATYRQKADAMV